MAFYAYIIIGMDYDSFSREGGTSYFRSAQSVVINAQSAGTTKGWKAFEGNVNRYWLSENLNNKVYAPLRNIMYDYHRNGLDLMAENSSKGRRTIYNLLPVLAQLDRQRIGSMLPLLFFTAKSDEMVSIFSKGEPREKTDAINILTQADPSNGNKYLNIAKN